MNIFSEKQPFADVLQNTLTQVFSCKKQPQGGVLKKRCHCTKNDVFHQGKISSVHMTKSRGNCGFGHIYWRSPSWKTSFSVQCVLFCKLLNVNISIDFLLKMVGYWYYTIGMYFEELVYPSALSSFRWN